MSWTDSQIESLITLYSSVLVSGARNFANGVHSDTHTREQFLKLTAGLGFTFALRVLPFCFLCCLLSMCQI